MNEKAGKELRDITILGDMQMSNLSRYDLVRTPVHAWVP